MSPGLDKMAGLRTEGSNEHTAALDQMNTLEMVQCINEEDHRVAEAVAKCSASIASAVDRTAAVLEKGGRLFYMGAGTSGRLGALDAYEFIPTFGVDANLVHALYAGKHEANPAVAEQLEDREPLGYEELKQSGFSASDVLVGLTASGRTPYVLGGLRYARALEAASIAISCNLQAAASKLADIAIEVDVGPEVLSGSTRMKAGTAQKMILNMLSTCTMVKLGRTYSHYMVYMKPGNDKLIERALNIICEVTGVERKAAEEVYNRSSKQLPAALVMIEAGVSLSFALECLQKANGRTRAAIEIAKKSIESRESKEDT